MTDYIASIDDRNPLNSFLSEHLNINFVAESARLRAIGFFLYLQFVDPSGTFDIPFSLTNPGATLINICSILEMIYIKNALAIT